MVAKSQQVWLFLPMRMQSSSVWSSMSSNPRNIRSLNRFAAVVARSSPGAMKRLVHGDRSLVDAINQRRPFDQLEHQGFGSVFLLNAIDGRDARVVEASKNLCFSLKPRQPIRIRSKRFRQYLERHLAVQLAEGTVDVADAPTSADRVSRRVGPR